MSKELAGELWNNTLAGGMRSVEGDITNLKTFFKLNTINRNGCFIWSEILFNLVRVIHVNNGYFVIPSYGLFFEINKIKVFITTDTQFNLEHLEKFYKQADMIFQDCETSQFPTKIHAHYQQLLTLPDSIRNKMWLYHYQPGTLPNAQKDGFCGFVKRGQTFQF